VKTIGEISHAQAHSLLQHSLDGPVNELQQAKLEHHLQGCVDCRHYAVTMSALNSQLKSSLQDRWPLINPASEKQSLILDRIRTRSRMYAIRSTLYTSFRNLAWVAFAALLIAGLVWTIKTLTPSSTQEPVGLITPEHTEMLLQATDLPHPTSSAIPSSTPLPPTPNPITGGIGIFPYLQFSFSTQLPLSPGRLTLYRQQLSQPVTADLARQVASRWGINAGVYASPSEGMQYDIFVATDGTHVMRFINFPDQYIYEVGYTGTGDNRAQMDNGPLPAFEEQVAIATNFLEPLGILDRPYRVSSMETERGMLAFIPLLDGYPVIQEIGIDRGNIGWIDVKVSSPGDVSMVQYSHHDFQPVGEYPILSAQQAWERFASDANLEYSRYAVLSPIVENTYRSWVPNFESGQQADIYGWVNSLQAMDGTIPYPVTLNNLPLMGEYSQQILPDNPLDVRFVHAWGEIKETSVGGIALDLAGWEISPLSEEYITGTITHQSNIVQLTTTDQTYTMLNPPEDLSDGLQAGIQAVVLAGEPPQLNWRFIQVGEVPAVYGSSSSCGGVGSGGYGMADANFGGGRFTLLNLAPQNIPVSPQPSQPYQPGEEILGVSGRVYVTRHLYENGKVEILEAFFSPDPSSNLDPAWAFSLVGPALSHIDQYNNLPITIWGQVDHLDQQTVYINVDHYEPVFPGETIQAWTGTEKLLTLEGQEVLLFTTSNGESYVLKSSVDFPPADANIIGLLGSVIEIEGYIIPNQQLGGYLFLQDTAGTSQPDGVVDSALPSIWDHSQDSPPNPGLLLQGQVTIDLIELAYDAVNLDRCQASFAEDPANLPWLYVQPMWVFTGHFDDGRWFFLQVQALPAELIN
jgi:hypothetical protein